MSSDHDRHLAYLSGAAERPAPSCPWPRREQARSTVRRWCVVQTEYRREATAAEEIRGLGYFVYLPKFKVRQVVPHNHRKWHDVVRPLLPGYLFAKVGDGAVPWGRLTRMRGVRDLLRFNDQPARVPDHVIDELRDGERWNFEDPYRPAAPVAVPFKVGDPVRLDYGGPFTGLHGEIASVDEASRLTVLIEAFGRRVRVRGLSPDEIERA